MRSQLIFSNAAHCCLVEVDRGPGWSFLEYVVVHDCGNEINPLIVEGMVHGPTVHGIGAALLEEFRYDENGQLLATTFMDYLKPMSYRRARHRTAPPRVSVPVRAARRQGRG